MYSHNQSSRRNEEVYGPIKIQADYSVKAFVAAERARVGIVTSAIDNFGKNQWGYGDIRYANGGHEAAAIDAYMEIVSFSEVEWGSIFGSLSYIRSFANKCKSVMSVHGATIAFQDAPGRSGYSLKSSTPDGAPREKHYVYIDDSVTDGRTYIAVLGCFSYRGVDEIFHTGICQFYKAGFTESLVPEYL